MSVARIPVNTTNLSVGMYVSMLDRPWLETPFIFQGFEIRDRFEIEQLQSYCSQVYVDIERGRLTAAQVRALAARGTRTRRRERPVSRTAGLGSRLGKLAVRLGLADLLARFRSRQAAGYPIKTTVRAEAGQAQAAYDRAVSHYRTIFERTQRVGAVDAESVAKALTPAVESIVRNPDAMAWTVFTGKRTGRNYNRAVATAVWSTIFGRHLGFERAKLDKLAMGGLLLDIGNVSLPGQLLHVEGAITMDDFELVSGHVQAGLEILSRSRNIAPEIVDMVACHHERFDGSGYPNQLSGSDIPPFGKIAGIVDCYDAMTTRTTYSPALAAYDAARELNEMRDKQFHASVVRQFLHAIGMFPTGSIVELNDGHIGLVLEQNRAHPLQPKLLLLLSPTGKKLDPLRVLNPDGWPQDDDAPLLSITRGHEHGAFGIDPADYFRIRS